MVNKYFKAILIFAFLIVTAVISAQGGPTPPGPCPGGDDCPETPIDGGLVGLGVLALGYAVKKILDNSKM